MSISKSIRHQLITLADRKTARVVDWSPERPTDWRPHSVRNPDGILETHFSDAAAWDLIVSQLAADCEVQTIILDKPPGATGYVMLIELEPGRPIYVKLQLGSGKIIGRSFHYSEKH